MKRVSIITVNYLQAAVTASFLASVKINTNVNEIEVIVVDNGVQDDNEQLYKSIYPEVVYIQSQANLGFAGGNNLGIRVASGEFLLFLNNDTEITSDLIEVLVSEFECNPEIGLLSPLLLYYDNPDIIQYAGFTRMNYLTCRNQGIGSFEINSGQFNMDSRETGYCHGAAMMCRKKDLEVVGMMPSDFFLYYEEIDWCEKFKKAGKKIWFTGKTKVYHKESISVGKESQLKTYFMTRNRMLFIRRNTGIVNTILFSFYYVFIACVKQMIIYMRKRRPELIKSVISGLVWNLTDAVEGWKKNPNNIR